MVIRKIASFDRLKNQIDTMGHFSGIACYKDLSLNSRQVLNYIYDELKYLRDRDLFNAFGRLMELSFGPSRVLIRTWHKVSSIRIKSFAISKQEKTEIIDFLTTISSIYSAILFVPQTNYIPKDSNLISYFIEYNNS